MWPLLWRVLLIELVLAGTVVTAAGRWDFPWFWAVIAVHATGFLVTAAVMDPGLREERLRPGPGAQDPRVRWLMTPFLIAHLVVAGLDVGRYHWSGTMPTGWHVAGLIGYVAGFALSIWAMATNRFFSPVVRLQTERGHRVVETGPYGVVRHPGYAGLMLSAICGGVAIGSWWSILPLLPIVGTLVWRIGMEERFLRDRLEGYSGYADRVRYRLVPGGW